MKLSNLKPWLPGMILGLSLLAAVPVSASITNSGSTPPPIKISKLSSTNDAAADSQNSDDSGKVYDFKDSKTSGVVTVTKNWDDSSSNDKRPVPDVSISTAKPGKNPLGYTITYHENELTFSDGSTENEMLVSSSGKILSGSYKIPDGLFAGWYSDKACTKRVEVDSNGIPVDGVTSDLNLYAKSKTFTLKSGPEFNVLIPSSATSIVFTDEVMPASATLIEVDADGDGGVVAWTEENETVMKVSTQMKGLKAQANTNSSYMFYSKSNLKKIDLTMLDTRNVTNMRAMFSACSGLADLDLTPIDTSKVINMRFMFDGCSGLTSLNLTNLDTKYVTNMDSMFRGCSGLTALDLSHLDTRNVTSMTSMFYDCSGLTTLDLSSLNTQKVMDMGKERFSGSCRTFDKNKRSRLCIHQKAFHNKCLSAVPVIYSKRFLVCLIQRIYPALKVSCQSHFPTGTDKLQELVLFQSNFFLRKTEKLFYRSPIIKDCTLP